MPYRTWCDECVETFGGEEVHSAHDRVHGRKIAVVSLDYVFITPKGLFTRKVIDELGDDDLSKSLDSSADIMKVVVLYCSLTRLVFAPAFRRKGADEHVVQQIVDNIAWLGHVRLVLRSDNELAILALVTQALRGLRVQLMDLESVSSE